MSRLLRARNGSIAAVLAVTVLTVALVASQSWLALLLFVLDGIKVAALIGAATLGGLWIVAVVLGKRLPLRWQLLLGAGFGLGGLALLVLVFGLLGWLQRGLWLVLMATIAIAGLVALWKARRNVPPPDTDPSRSHRWLWLLVCPFLAVAILVAVIPPGFLWAEEGAGYDVLEYHLQLPKEYLEAGRIQYAPHNVYANFPANVEMLYLLCLIVQGDVLTGAMLAKLLNAGLDVLFVAAAWLAGRERSRAAGTVAGVVAAATGYVTYLCGIAFVENGMMFFGMIAMAALVRASRAEQTPRVVWRHLAAAGLLAGLSAGCKYTAVAMVALPLAVAVAVRFSRDRALRFRAPAVFVLTALASFSPWLIKNIAMTGNPVFPLANTGFQAGPPGWGPEETAHFAESHAPAPEDRTAAARLRMLWQRVPGDEFQRYGPLVLCLALIPLISPRREPIDWLCLLVLGVQIMVWLFATHLYSRFAMPLLIPLIVLAGRSIEVLRSHVARACLISAIIAGAAFNFYHVRRLYTQHLYVDGTKAPLEGATEFFADGLGMGHEHLAIINHELPNDARVLMVGDAKAFYFQRQVDYCVVFNRSPFVEAVRAAKSDSDVIEWLRERGYTHVFVNWAEIRRLRRSRYGFPPEVSEDLFARLVTAGLKHVGPITDSLSNARYADLFEVPRS